MGIEADRNAGSTFLSSDRLASLSDTMFGVAMTLLATTLIPSVQALTGPAFVLQHMGGELGAVVLSFAISSVYWVSHQCRLATTPWVARRQILMNLVFLFLIVLLPISTSLLGRAGTTQGVVMLYGTHLVLIAAMNLLLWIDVHRRVDASAWIMGSSLALALFVGALAVGAVWPEFAEYIWPAGFAVPLLNRQLVRLMRMT